MLLAEMGPNAIIEKYSDLGSREIDKNYNWVGDVRQRHPSTDFANVTTFLQQVRDENTLDSESISSVDFETLNEKQKAIYNRIKEHYLAVIKELSKLLLWERRELENRI